VLGCIAITLLPTMIMGIAVYKAFFDVDASKGLIFSAAAVVAGVILYFVAVGLNPAARAEPS
jgi:hypothetical protein